MSSPLASPPRSGVSPSSPVPLQSRLSVDETKYRPCFKPAIWQQAKIHHNPEYPTLDETRHSWRSLAPTVVREFSDVISTNISLHVPRGKRQYTCDFCNFGSTYDAVDSSQGKSQKCNSPSLFVLTH